MQIEILINGGVTVLLSPENPMEEELIKSLMKQENVITEFRSPVTVINKTFRNGMVIGKKSGTSISKLDELEVIKED